DFGFEDIEKARALVLAGKGAEDISSGLRIEMLGNYCHLINQGQEPRIINFPQLASLTEVKQLYVGDALDLNEGWRLHAQLIDAQSYAQMPEATRKNANHAFLSLPKPEVPLQVRAMKAGERWASLGLKTGSQKLSDFFVNNKIPQAARAKWPLVLREESILWVPGLRIAHAWRLKGDETIILHLSLVHNQDF
ncbi:MAG: tRNA lysidine(34) synthetase TilS, partial [Chloroflexi bacterium]|nr:tRNA lysidine(34) synthetase TilS [Chloroflexota bacterium]